MQLATPWMSAWEELTYIEVQQPASNLSQTLCNIVKSLPFADSQESTADSQPESTTIHQNEC